MKKFKFYLSIGFVGAEHESTVEYEDDVKPEEVEEDLKDWVNGYIEYYSELVEEEPK